MDWILERALRLSLIHICKLLYQLGAVYKFTPHIATFANYSESFRPQMSVATPVSGDLKPEQGKSFEIGAKYENSGFNATLALFNITKRNVAESVGSGSNAQLNIVGKQRSRGVEFDLNGQDVYKRQDIYRAWLIRCKAYWFAFVIPLNHGISVTI